MLIVLRCNIQVCTRIYASIFSVPQVHSNVWASLECCVLSTFYYLSIRVTRHCAEESIHTIQSNLCKHLTYITW